jgi:hypothetical protein
VILNTHLELEIQIFDLRVFFYLFFCLYILEGSILWKMLTNAIVKFSWKLCNQPLKDEKNVVFYRELSLFNILN